ncbi:MAG: amidase [Acidimicrobiia bacterium]|nr:amidase [Acidimicrobiia bacterium]
MFVSGTDSIDTIVDEVRKGVRTAHQVLDHYLERAERLNPALNAFYEIHQEEAREQADSIDSRLRAGAAPGRLCGVPIALKDLIDQAGQVTTAGSAFYRHRAKESATVVRRLEAEGAVIMGRTVLHEFAFGFSSENPWFGPVRNPWNLRLSPGGSSGGSAVAVAAGMAPAGIGTDTGGSVRVPAALCGLVGLKVTHGAIPLTGVFPLAGSLDTVGPMAKTVRDARVLFRVMSGYDPRDPWSTPSPAGADRIDRLQGLRIGVPSDWLSAVPTSAMVRDSFGLFCEDLSDLGAEVEVIEESGLKPGPLLQMVPAAEAAAVHRRWFADPDKPYGPDLEIRLGAAMEVPVDRYTEAMRWRAGVKNAAAKIFDDFDLLVTPAVGHAAKTIGEDTIEINGQPLFYREVLNGYSALVNMIGCPALALPTNRPGSPPPAIQLLAPWWGEEALLDVGTLFEQTGLIGFTPPPPLPELPA